MKKILFIRKIIPSLMVFLGYLFLYIPIVVLALFSFNDSDISVGWTGFSLRWYYALFDSPELINALQVSLIVAICSTTLSILLGMFFVLGCHWWRTYLGYTIFYINILLPDIILAVGLLITFSFLNLELGYASLIIGHTLIGLGFVVPIISARFNEFDPLLTEASLDLGANYFKTCVKVLIPLLAPALIAAALLAFTLSLDDFMISFFCSGARIQTLSLFIYYKIRTLVDPTINVVSTFLLATSSLVVMILCYFKLIDHIVLHD